MLLFQFVYNKNKDLSPTTLENLRPDEEKPLFDRNFEI